jgi:hypothetical protein
VPQLQSVSLLVAIRYCVISSVELQFFRQVAIGPSSCNWLQLVHQVAIGCNWSVKLQLVQLRSCNRRVCAFTIQNAPGCILVSPYIYTVYILCTWVHSIQRMHPGRPTRLVGPTGFYQPTNRARTAHHSAPSREQTTSTLSLPLPPPSSRLTLFTSVPISALLSTVGGAA